MHRHVRNNMVRATVVVAGLLALGVGMWIALGNPAERSPVTAEEMGAEARQLRDDLVSSLTEDQVLYYRIHDYQRERLGLSSKHSYPQRVIIDTWLLVGADGSEEVGMSKELSEQGELLSYSVMRDGQLTHWDLVADEVLEMELPEESGTSLADWITGVWDQPKRLEEQGYTLKEQSALVGRPSAVYELTDRSNIEGPERGSVGRERVEIEFVYDAPLISREAVYDIQDGQETLLFETTLSEYGVLPGSEFPPIPEFPPVPRFPSDIVPDAIHGID